MPDIIRLILDDHESFRTRFAELAELRGDAVAAQAVWAPLSADLEVHASAEEKVFYPALLKKVDEDLTDEAEDAVEDHDDIRHGIRRAAAADVGSEEWWAGITEAREANDHHLAEEERDDIAPFLQNISVEVRHELGDAFAAFKRDHAHGEGLDYADVDAEQYLKEHS